jgi:hypothetical protein
MSEPEKSGRSVVLGLDTSPGAQRAQTVAIRIARALDVPLVLVHGVEPPGRVGEEVGEAREAIEELDERVTRPAVAAAEAAGVRAVVEIVEDRPAPALVAVADEHDAEVIVVGIWNEPAARPAARVGGAQASSAVGPAGALRAGRRFLTVSRPGPSPDGPGRALRAQTAPGYGVGGSEYARYEDPPPPCQEPSGSRSASTSAGRARPTLQPCSIRRHPNPVCRTSSSGVCARPTARRPCARCAGPISPCGPVSSSR